MRLTSPACGTPALVALAVLLFAIVPTSGLLLGPTPAAFAQVPAQVTLDGEWELDRTERDPCIVAVPQVLRGTIHIEADFVAGTVSGSFDGSAAGNYVLPARCRHVSPSEYDLSHLETWTAEVPVIQATFSGTLDRITGAFDVDAVVYAEGEGERTTPGGTYRCGTDYETLACDLGSFAGDQPAEVYGTITPTGVNRGGFDWYSNYVALISPGRINWGPHGMTIGTWAADVTNVVWRENQAPEVGAIASSPADPTTDDAIVFTVEATDPDEDTLTYAWYIDGAREGPSAPSVTWATPTAGDHVIKVTVTDGGESVDAFLDLRVSEHVGEGDRDDDGVPDDEDLCPDEWGENEDGCPPFVASVACAPAKPLPEDAVVCTATVAGLHVGEEPLFDWYLDGGSVQSSVSAAWTWGSAESGTHDIGVQAIGEGRSSDADVSLIVGGGPVDEATAGFHITSLGCNSGVSSDDTLQCSVTFERDRDDVGPLLVTFSVEWVATPSDLISGSRADWALDEPAPGDHTVLVSLVDPATNYSIGGMTSGNVTPGKNAMVPPAVQAGAAIATTLTAGAWLWLEWARRRQEEARIADEEVALDADRQKWYARIMGLNRAERQRREAYAAALQAQQDAAQAEWKHLVDGLDRSIDQGARLEEIRDFVERHEDEVFKDGVWDPAAVAGIQDKVQRLGLSQSDRDFYQAKADFHDHVGPVLDSAFELSRSIWVRIGTGILTGGWSEAAWIPLSAGDATWRTITDTTKKGRARSAETAVWTGAKQMARDTAALLLWGQVFKAGASTFAPEINAAGKFLKQDFAKWWSVGKVKQAWAALPPGARTKLTTYADDTWSFLNKKRQMLPDKPQPQLPVIRHEWGKPVTYLSRDGVTSWSAARPAGWGTARLTPWVERLDRLAAVGLEDDVVRFMTKATGEGLELGGVSSLRFGSGDGSQRLSTALIDPATGRPSGTFRLNAALTADEEVALRIMQRSDYRRLLADGMIPKPLHAAAVHARDHYVKLQTAAALERLSPSVREHLVRIDFTGTGARPHSAAATSTRFTDLDLTPRGTPDAAGRAAESAFRRELDLGMRGDAIWGEGGFNRATTDVNIFPGLHRSASPAQGGYGSARMIHWQEVDSSLRARSAIPTEGGVVFDAAPAARPMAGQGSIQPVHSSPPPSSAAVVDAGRVIGGHVADMSRTPGRLPTRLEVLTAEGKHARRVWWASNRGTGQAPPAWIQQLDDLKLHPTTPQSPQAVEDMWRGFSSMFGEYANLEGFR